MEAIWRWCKRSATIVWARMQYVGGVLSAGLIVAFSGYDFTSLASLDGKAVFKILLAVSVSGVLTELARRRTLRQNLVSRSMLCMSTRRECLHEYEKPVRNLMRRFKTHERYLPSRR